MKKRKSYTAQKKAMILREHLENQVSISELSERFKISPNMIHKWKKQLFETCAKSGALSIIA
jgi:transposase-like protein